MRIFLLTLVSIVLFVGTATAGDIIPPEKLEVIDNDGYSWGYIPPIENVDQQMNHVKFNPILSPDGEWMVFLGRFNRKLWLVPSEGGTPVEIFNLRNEPMPEGARAQTIENPSLQFSPDGSEISFTISIYNPEMGSFDANPDTAFSMPSVTPSLS